MATHQPNTVESENRNKIGEITDLEKSKKIDSMNIREKSVMTYANVVSGKYAKNQ